ncbi:hypothetical protein, partial [Flammeovirga sp. SJP92]|uniref:hypothetical protein n=1 Tax=Flammeovirga sp. SJP92 TaxID=1775430 RepID=UPI001C12B6AA
TVSFFQGITDRFIIRIILGVLSIAMMTIASDFQDNKYFWVMYINTPLFMLTYYILDKKQKRERRF